MNANHSDIEQQCAVAVDQLLRRYDWRLLDRDEFVRRTIALIDTNAASNPNYAAFGAYNQALYDACTGAQGIARWELGFTELSHLLYNRARWYCPDIWEDATQLALENTCARLDRCHEPRAFFTFAVHQLMNAARSIQRQERRQPVSLDIAVGETGDTLGDLRSDDAPDPLDLLLSHEFRARIREFVDSYVRKHHRAGNQIAALLLKELEGLDDEVIAHTLQVRISAIPTLRSRARERLREDPELQLLARDLGIIADERVE
jgi:RNA polymerase sigma factor (sigma-70 family)